MSTTAPMQTDGAIIAAAAARAVGVPEKYAFAGLSERQGNVAASTRSTSLKAIMAMSAEHLGMSMPFLHDEHFLHDFLRRDRDSHRQQLSAARSRGDITASSSAGFSTMSLTGITENVMNKTMLAAYASIASVVPDIAYERDVQDFRPFKTYRLTATGDLLPVGPGGEIKNMGLQDSSYGGQLTTKAAVMVLKREDIINDDMGALNQIASICARKGALNRERVVITTVLAAVNAVAPGSSAGKTPNGFNFWSTGAKNYLSGANSALGMDSLTRAVSMLYSQTDDDNDPIAVMPDRILVGPDNAAPAQNLFNGANLTVQSYTTPATGAGTASQVVDLNQHKGMYRPIVTPYLAANSPVTGATGKQWVLLPNPAGGMSPLQVAYLRGQRTPMIKQVDVDAGVLGIAYQVIYDFGVSLLDYRCGVFSTGQ